MNEPRVLENPANGHLLRALEGDREALKWLLLHRKHLGAFAQAVVGGKKAVENFGSLDGLGEELFEAIGDASLNATLKNRHPEVHALFEAIKGDNTALDRLQRKKPSLARLAEIVRAAHEKSLEARDDRVGPQELADSAADVGCLIGEMHLARGEFEKAVQAFTRAIETHPTADAYEGRARAYTALALHDQQRAEQLREL